MRRLNGPFLFVLAVLFHGLFTVNVYAADEKPVETQTDVQQVNWEFILEIYFWMAEIDATTAGGQDLEFDFDTIMENLDLTLMAAIGTRKDKWNFLIDVVYLDISESSDSNINPVLQLTDRGLEGWIVNPVVAYEIMGGEKGSLQLLAGVGYQFDTFKLLAAYRYMDWDFGDDAVLDDLQVSGPVIGTIFTF